MNVHNEVRVHVRLFTDPFLWLQQVSHGSTEPALMELLLIKKGLSYVHPLAPAGSFFPVIFSFGLESGCEVEIHG